MNGCVAFFQFVDENYEGELQEAILQSKIDYEENKDFYDRVKKELEAEKKLTAAGGKKKKSKAMSLEEFNNMQVCGITLGVVWVSGVKWSVIFIFILFIKVISFVGNF